MQKAEGNKTYYVMDSQTEPLEAAQNHTFAKFTATASGEATQYSCTAKLKVEKSGTMELESGDAFINLTGASITGVQNFANKDLSEIESSSEEDLTFDLTAGSDLTIKGDVTLVNKQNSDQTTKLANKTLQVKITVSDLNCTVKSE